MPSLLFNKYWLYLRSGSSSTKGFLYLVSDNGTTMIRFTKDTPAAPTRTGNHITCQYPVEMMQGVLDTVRNEKPIYVIYDSNLARVDIGTAEEPIGESEPS